MPAPGSVYTLKCVFHLISCYSHNLKAKVFQLTAADHYYFKAKRCPNENNLKRTHLQRYGQDAEVPTSGRPIPGPLTAGPVTAQRPRGVRGRVASGIPMRGTVENGSV